MKKLIIAAMLTAMAGHAHAQETPTAPVSRAHPTSVQQNFEINPEWVNIRDYIYLPNQEKVIVELTHAEQYNELKNIDTLLLSFMRDIAFYKDSLADNSGSIRIDYAQDDKAGIRKIRFKKHPGDGAAFMGMNGEKSKLKIDQDTVRIYVRHYPLHPSSEVSGKLKDRKTLTRAQYREMYNKAQMYQLTFCVNNYEDILKIAADPQNLRLAIDTMLSTKRHGTLSDPHKFPSSALYNPYATRDDIKNRYWRSVADVRFKQYGGLLKSETADNWRTINRADKLLLNGNLGVGLLRNTWAPVAEAGLYFSSQSRRPHNGEYNHLVAGLSASCYYLFERGADNTYYSKPNWFANATISEGDDLTFGVGYLFHSKGDFFKGTTAKFFFDVRLLKKGLTLSPELIFTNNFQQIIPALTVKIR